MTYYTCDTRHWFGMPPEGCDVPWWLPFLAPETLGMDPKRKFTLDLATGEIIEGFPTKWPLPSNPVGGSDAPEAA